MLGIYLAFFGFLGAAVALALFTAGIYLGWRLRDMPAQNSVPPDQNSINPVNPVNPEISESERRRIRQEQEAFRRLQNYSVNDAYGMNPDGPNISDRPDRKDV